MGTKADFEFIRPDEFAECIDGVLASGDLYEKLWACVPKYRAPSPEVSEEPVYGADNLAEFWNEFSPEDQAKICELWDANQARDKKNMQEFYAREGRPCPEWYL